RVQGAFPSDEIERVVAQGDAGDLPTSVLHIDREFSAGILERRQVWGLDLRFDDRRHQGGLALFVQVVRRERDRVDRLDQEEPGFRRCQVDPVGRALRIDLTSPKAWFLLVESIYPIRRNQAFGDVKSIR